MPKCSDLLQLGAANHMPRGKTMLVKIQRRVEGKENEHINNTVQPMLEGLGHINRPNESSVLYITAPIGSCASTLPPQALDLHREERYETGESAHNNGPCLHWHSLALFLLGFTGVCV